MWAVVLQESIAAVAEQGFDVIVVAAGAASINIAELKDKLPLKGVRAQVSIGTRLVNCAYGIAVKTRECVASLRMPRPRLHLPLFSLLSAWRLATDAHISLWPEHRVCEASRGGSKRTVSRCSNHIRKVGCVNGRCAFQELSAELIGVCGWLQVSGSPRWA